MYCISEVFMGGGGAQHPHILPFWSPSFRIIILPLLVLQTVSLEISKLSISLPNSNHTSFYYPNVSAYIANIKEELWEWTSLPCLTSVKITLLVSLEHYVGFGVKRLFFPSIFYFSLFTHPFIHQYSSVYFPQNTKLSHNYSTMIRMMKLQL